MTLIQVVLGIFGFGSLVEWNHLRKDKIRHNETPYLYVGFLLILILIITLFFDEK